MAQTGGEVLREARRKKKVTQEELAERADTTQTSIARWEADKRSPTVRQLAGLLEALGYELELRARPISRRKPGAPGFGSALGETGRMQRGKRRQTG